MYGVFACAAVAACALVFASPAAARPYTDVSSLQPVNKQGQQLRTVRRGRPVTVVIGFRMKSAPRSAGYRVRVQYRLARPGNRVQVRSTRAPVVWTGVYRFRLPLTVPRHFKRGTYRLTGIVEVLDGKKVVAMDLRRRGVTIR
jgi:hypothetical protein